MCVCISVSTLVFFSFIFLCVSLCVSQYIFTYLSERAERDTRSVLSGVWTDLISEVSFSKTVCYTKVEKPSLPNWKNSNWVLANVKCKQCRPGFELVSPCPFPSTVCIYYSTNVSFAFLGMSQFAYMCASISAIFVCLRIFRCVWMFYRACVCVCVCVAMTMYLFASISVREISICIMVSVYLCVLDSMSSVWRRETETEKDGRKNGRMDRKTEIVFTNVT